jgi:hypothetical protein
MFAWESRVLIEADRRNRPKKELAQNRFQASPVRFYILRQLSTNGGSNDDGGGGSTDARCTSSMRGPCNSHSTDMVGSIHTDNSRIRNPDSQFRRKSERQNAAQGRKPIHLPPMQLREAFSYNFPSCLLFLFREEWEAPAKDFPDA